MNKLKNYLNKKNNSINKNNYQIYSLRKIF